MSAVTLIDTGVANLASMRAAFARLGAEVRVTADADAVRRAERLVLPGVGAFGAGMAALRARALDDALRDAVAAGTPLLGVCLGMQLLGEGSDEAPGVPGLGILPARCRGLADASPVPNLGWGRIVPAPDCRLLAPMWAAFAHAFAFAAPPPGWRAAFGRHGDRFVAGLERGRTLACQFHPELSGAAGAALLDRWMRDLAADDRARASGPDAARVRLIPCLDTRDGRVVKGVRFQDLRDAGDPAARAALYEAQGADEIVLLDVAASAEDRALRLETVRAVRAGIGIPLTVGGGVASTADARRLLEAGADRISVNSAALADPALIGTLAEAFGRQCVVIAIDARRREGDWEVLSHGGRRRSGRDAVTWAREAASRGAGEVLLTSWDRDGTRSGCDLALLRAVVEAVPVPVIASGGIGTRDDVADAVEGGAAAVLAASILHDGDETVAGIKQHLAARGIGVRP